MPRSLKKGPYVDPRVNKKVMKQKETGTKEPIKKGIFWRMFFLEIDWCKCQSINSKINGNMMNEGFESNEKIKNNKLKTINLLRCSER